MSERSIKGVVYDVDGTLLDTFEHIVRAFEIVLPQFGVTRGRDEIKSVVGKTLQDCYRHFLGEELYEEAARMHHQTQQTAEMYGLIVAYDGLVDTLDALRGSGIKQAILTNRSRGSLELIFDHVGLTGKFDDIVAAGDVPTSKPNPEGAHLVSEKLRLDTSELIMVGDTAIDIETARNAHMRGAVGVTHGFGSHSSLEAAGADFIINSLAELPAAVRKLEGK